VAVHAPVDRTDAGLVAAGSPLAEIETRAEVIA